MTNPTAPTESQPISLRRTLTPLMVAAFLVVFNETILAVALPSIMNDLGVSADIAQWVTSAYMLTMACVIPASGFLLRRFGVRRLFLTAMIGFVAGTLSAALTMSFAVLLMARIVQATGAALVMPALLTTIAQHVPAHRRGTVMGTASIVIGAAPALGPATSGFGLELVGWHGLFWIILAVALTVLFFGTWSLPADQSTESAPLDLWSMGLSVLAFGGTVLGLSFIQSGEATTGWACLTCGLGLIAVFVSRQVRMARSRVPYLDLRTFAEPRFALAMTTAAAVSAILFSTVSIVPLLLQNVMHTSSTLTGLMMLPGGAMIALLSPLSGRLVDRIGAAPVMVPAALIVLAATVTFAVMPQEGGIGTVSAAFIALHVGLAGLLTPMMTVALDAVTPVQGPDASATFSTTQQLCGAAGTAALIGVMQSVAGPGAAVTIEGVHAAFSVSVGLALVAVGAALGLAMMTWRRARKTRF
ncbi:MAG: DHA2 family efflux MFS transporter permease subunit [Mycolicibacterium neoaurum]|uniref:DHA2 family efflux MFS transporter permease subunit n=1 Tax=Mycolicibacterium neoaurum TaxID=1795 RepID=UPI002FF78CB2